MATVKLPTKVGPTRVHNSMEVFVQTYIECKGNVKEIATKLSLKDATVSVRKSAINKTLKSKNRKLLPVFATVSKSRVDYDAIEQMIADHSEVV